MSRTRGYGILLQLLETVTRVSRVSVNKNNGMKFLYLVVGSQILFVRSFVVVVVLLYGLFFLHQIFPLETFEFLEFEIIRIFFFV